MTTIVLPSISAAPRSSGRRHRRAGGYAGRNAFEPGDLARRGERRGAIDGHNLVDDFASRMAGTKPAPMPWILCGPGGPPDRTGYSSGSTAIILTPGLRALSTSPTPVIVPPVPTPENTISTPPSVSFQISSAVVRRWISGLAGFSNCRQDAARRRGDQLGARAMAPSCLAPQASIRVRRRAASASCGALSTCFQA